MKALTCAATRRRLDAFHDGELPIADQIAVSAHLDWCDELRGDARRAAVGAARRCARSRPAACALSKDEAAGLQHDAS